MAAYLAPISLSLWKCTIWHPWFLAIIHQGSHRGRVFRCPMVEEGHRINMDSTSTHHLYMGLMRTNQPFSRVLWCLSRIANSMVPKWSMLSITSRTVASMDQLVDQVRQVPSQCKCPRTPSKAEVHTKSKHCPGHLVDWWPLGRALPVTTTTITMWTC